MSGADGTTESGVADGWSTYMSPPRRSGHLPAVPTLRPSRLPGLPAARPGGLSLCGLLEGGAAATRGGIGRVMAGDERPTVTYALIGTCVAAYVLQWVLPGITDRFDFTPFFGRQEPWRLMTATFLHAPNSPMHILFNMFALWQVGQFLEPVLGRWRFLALYQTSALGGSVMYLVMATPPLTRLEMIDSTWLTGTVGASGAVFGLFAALLGLARRLRLSETGLLVLLGINAVLPFFYRNIAWQAHLGGFVTGLLVVGILLATRQRSRARWQWPAIAALVAALIGTAILKYSVSDDAYLGIPRSSISAAAPETPRL